MGFAEFEEIRKLHLQNGTLFEDDGFPSADDLGFFGRRRSNVQWLRPRELCELKGSEAKVFHDSGLEIHDMYNETPDPGFPVRFNRLVMPGQSFNDGWYAGVFHFCFWRDGTVMEVVIDDRLPCYQGNIATVRNRRQYELINPLIEKALAKSYGGFAAIEDYAFEDIAADCYGRCVELVPLSSPLNELRRMFSTAFKRGSLVMATIQWSANRIVESNGLVNGCPYLITSFRKVPSDTGEDDYLIRTKTRWPMNVAYTGPWSQSSPEWNRLSQEARTALGLTLPNKYEFWMRLNDLRDSCVLLEFCHLLPQLGLPEARTWSVKVLYSAWNRIGTPDGTRGANNYYRNPRFLLRINSCDAGHSNLATIILELTQKNRRIQKRPYFPIAFFLYRLEDQPDIPVLKRKFKEIFRSRSCRPVRTLVDRHNLSVGNYSIIAATRERYQEGQFMLRMFSETPHELVEVMAPPL